MKTKFLAMTQTTLFLLAVAPLHATELPSERYLCMEPVSIATDPTLSDVKELPSIKARPTDESQSIGIGTRIVFVMRNSQKNGYLEATLYNGQHGWVKAVSVQPYHNLRHPEKACSVVETGGGKLTYRLH